MWGCRAWGGVPHESLRPSRDSWRPRIGLAARARFLPDVVPEMGGSFSRTPFLSPRDTFKYSYCS